MSGQGDLVRFFEPNGERGGLFFALLLREEDRAHMAAFACERRRVEGLAGALTPAARLHLSLHAIGDYVGLPDRIIRASREAGASIDVRAFAVAFDRTMTFAIKQRKNAFVLCAREGMPALETLYRDLGEALCRVGLVRYASRHFTPHITLLYDRRAVPERSIPQISLRFEEFVLIHSLAQPRRHIHVARWPLRQ